MTMKPTAGDVFLLTSGFPQPFQTLAISTTRKNRDGHTAKTFVSGPHRLVPGDQFLVLETEKRPGVCGCEIKEFLFMKLLTSSGAVGWLCFSHTVEPWLEKRVP